MRGRDEMKKGWLTNNPDPTITVEDDLRAEQAGLVHVFRDGQAMWSFEPLPVRSEPRLVRDRGSLALIVSNEICAPVLLDEGIFDRRAVIAIEECLERPCAVLLVRGPAGSLTQPIVEVMRRRTGVEVMTVCATDLDTGRSAREAVTSFRRKAAGRMLLVRDAHLLSRPQFDDLGSALKFQVRNPDGRPMPRAIVVLAEDCATAQGYPPTWFKAIDLRPLSERIDQIPHIIARVVAATALSLKLTSEFVEACMTRAWASEIDLIAGVCHAIAYAERTGATTLQPADGPRH